MKAKARLAEDLKGRSPHLRNFWLSMSIARSAETMVGDLIIVSDQDHLWSKGLTVEIIVRETSVRQCHITLLSSQCPSHGDLLLLVFLRVHRGAGMAHGCHLQCLLDHFIWGGQHLGDPCSIGYHILVMIALIKEVGTVGPKRRLEGGGE